MTTTNKPMTGEQLDELMTIAVNMQRDSEKIGERSVAMFAYAVQVAVLEIRDVRSQLAESQSRLEKMAAENAALKAAAKETLAHWAAAEPGEMEQMMDKCMPSLRVSYCETPATDSILAEVRNEAGARAVELFAKTLGSPYAVRDEKCYEDGFTRAIEIVRDTQAPRFAAQLREVAK
jgi:protein subunit release factor A